MSEFVTEVYCGNYPSDLLTNPARMTELMEKELLYCSIALDEHGKICGHLGSLYENANEVTGDSLAATVAEGVRSQNMMVEMSGPLMKVWQQRGTIGMHQYATTVHDISQRKIAQGGGITTGVLLADWPGALQVSGFSAAPEIRSARESTPFVTMYFAFAAGPQRALCLPEEYADCIQNVMQQLPGKRTTQCSLADTANPIDSACQLIERPRQGVAVLRFQTIGKDYTSKVEHFLKLDQPYNALYIDVPLDALAGPVLVSTCRQYGWFFGCVLPERNGTDYLRLQKTSVRVQREHIALWESAENLFEFIVRDQHEVSN